MMLRKRDWIPGDNGKRDLPDQSDANEAVEKGGMGDGRRIFFANEIEHEVERRDREETRDGGEPENNFCEFQGRLQEGSLPEAMRIGLPNVHP